MKSLHYLRTILPQPHYEAVVRNIKTQNPEKLDFWSNVSERKDPIVAMFNWENTPEGDFFWRDVHMATISIDPFRKSIEPFPIPPHKSWPTQEAPLSGHPGPETPMTGTNNKTTTMLHKYADKPVATPTLVNGQDVTDLSDREILNQIKARKKSVEEIIATGAVGAYVDHFRTQEGIAIEALLKELNSRAPQAAVAPATEA